MASDGLGNSPDLCAYEYSQLQSHRVVGDVHLGVFDGELYLWGHQFGVLVNGNLVYRRVILLLFFLSLLLLLFRSHALSL
jgi:hypothetical protein